MSDDEIAFLPEQPGHNDIIEEINAEAFGPGRFTRAAYRLREGGPHDMALSFVAASGGNVVGSVRQSWVCAGGKNGLLLGPLAVRPAWKSRGIGRKLVEFAVEAAKKANAPLVVLVGDAPYYSPFGFTQLPPGKITLPGPVDPARLLAVELEDGALQRFSGAMIHSNQRRSGRIY